MRGPGHTRTGRRWRQSCRRAYALASDAEGEALTAAIAALPPIPKANHPAQGMRAEYLVTPVVFALDPRLRYPIINGAERVQVLLRRIGVADDSLEASTGRWCA